MRFGNSAITLVATIVMGQKALSHAAFHCISPRPQSARNGSSGKFGADDIFPPSFICKKQHGKPALHL
jgi:hypothetical protein